MNSPTIQANVRYRLKRTGNGRPIVTLVKEVNDAIVVCQFEKDQTLVIVRKDLLIPA